MEVFQEELLYEIEWRTNEISILKTIPFLYPLSDVQRRTIERHTIPAMYSLWEGYVVSAFQIYVRELNRLKLTADKIRSCILTHAIDTDLCLSNGRAVFEKKEQFIEKLSNFFNGEVIIPNKLPTESNINYRVINSILYRFSLESLPERPYKKELDKLLLVRNSIAHGEVSIPIDKEIIAEISFTILNLMHDVFNRIVDGHNTKTYLRCI